MNDQTTDTTLCPECTRGYHVNHRDDPTLPCTAPGCACAWPQSEARTEWNTQELQQDFTVLGFQAPFVVVRRKADGQLGSLQFDHSPRRYYDWMAD